MGAYNVWGKIYIVVKISIPTGNRFTHLVPVVLGMAPFFIGSEGRYAPGYGAVKLRWLTSTARLYLVIHTGTEPEGRFNTRGCEC